MLKKIEEKLAYQLLIRIMSVIAIVLFVVGISVAMFVRFTSEAELNRRLNVESLHVKNEIVALFENAETYSKQLTLNESVIKYLEDVDSRDEIKNHYKYEEVVDVLMSINESDQSNFLAWVANEKGNFFLSGEGNISGPTYVTKNRPWYKEEKFSESIYFSKPHFDMGTNIVVMSAINTIELPNSDRGFVSVEFNLNIIPKVIEKIDVGFEGQVYVVDEDELFIFHPTKQFILQKTLKEEMPKLDEKLLMASSNSLKTVTIDGKAYYLKTLLIEKNQWRVVVLIKVSEVMAPLKEFLWMFLAILLMVVVIISAFVTWSIQKRLKPIEGLKKYGALVAKGHLDETPPYEYVNRQDEMGDLARSFVTITEVFKQKNMTLEERVQNQQKEIQKQYHYILEREKVASVGTLVAGVAHEINTPLGISITTGTYIEDLVLEIMNNHKSKKLSKSFLEKRLLSIDEASDLLLSNLNRADGLVTQFKDITRPDTSEDLEIIHLKSFIDEVIKNLKPAFSKRPLELFNEIDDNIEILSIKRSLTQVFTNLIMNSLHHGFSKDQRGQLIFYGELYDNKVRLIYKDNGNGMTRDTIEHLFEPFFTTKRNSNNSGLGMFIIHNLIHQNLKGSLSCESELGQGVSFKIILPKQLEIKDSGMRPSL